LAATTSSSAQPVLPGESDAAEIVERQLIREGITVLCNAKPIRVEMSAAGKLLVIATARQEQTLAADAILAAAGRTPMSKGST
jgi:pyruvate/2-oxoglutarate dehydrogenase complex dihydrolipoamide dehydrogenase (E3) component